MRNIVLSAVTFNDTAGTKTFTRVNIPASSQPVYEWKVPKEKIHYCFDSLPLCDENGLEYSYRITEAKIGMNEVKEDQTYLSFVPGTNIDDDEYSYVRTIRRGTANYYVDYDEEKQVEYTDDEGVVHTGEPPQQSPYTREPYGECIILNEISIDTVSFSNFKAEKIWDDENNLYGRRPDSITYTLKRTKTLNGVTNVDESFASPKTVTALDNWTAEWKQCAAKSPDGGQFDYYIEESTVEYYTVADVDEEQENTKVYTFTNTYLPEKRDITAYKVWDDQSNFYGLRPFSVKYELWCLYALYERKSTTNDDGKEIVTFEPVLDENGKQMYFNGRVYDPQEQENEKQSAVYQAMLSEDPTLTGQRAGEYFTRILDASRQDGSDKNRWKVTFKNLPDYVNGLADNVWGGQSAQVTYYIKESFGEDDTTAATLYLCPDKDDTMRSDELVLMQYGQSFTGVTGESITLAGGVLYNSAADTFTAERSAIQDGKYHVTVSGLSDNRTYEIVDVKGGTVSSLTRSDPSQNNKVSLTIEITPSSSETENLSFRLEGYDISNDAGVFTVPKSYSLNGVQSFEIPDLQSTDIFGNPYRYYVKEYGTSSGGTVTTQESAFRDNSGGKTTVLVTNELPKLFFRIQRKIDPKAESRTVIKNEDGSRLTLKINGITYQADDTGLFAVPQIYTGTGSSTEIQSFSIAGLPKEKSAERLYIYSVQECKSDGTSVANSSLTLSQTDDSEHTGCVKLTFNKPLGSESPDVKYQLFRRVQGKSYTYIVTDSDNHSIDGVTAVASTAVDGKVKLLVSVPGGESPYTLKVRRSEDGKTFEDVSITAVDAVNAEQIYESDDNSTFTLPAGTSVYIQNLAAAASDGNEAGPLTQIVYEKCIAAEVNTLQYPVNEEGIISVPKSSVRRHNIMVTVPNLPKYFGSQHDEAHKYIYSIEECASSSDTTAVSISTVTFTSVDSGDDKVTLTVKTMSPTLLFRVMQKAGESAPAVPVTTFAEADRPTMNGTALIPSGNGVVTAEEKYMEFSVKINGLPQNSYSLEEYDKNGLPVAPNTLTLTPSTTDGTTSLTISKAFSNVYYRIFKENETTPVTSVNEGSNRLMAMVGSEKFTAAPDGMLVISEYYARGDQLTVKVPGLPAGNYIVKTYGENGDVLTSQTVTMTPEEGEETGVLTWKETVTATPDVFRFKIKASNQTVYHVMTGSQPLKVYKFLVSDQPIGDNDLTAAADHRVSITNTLAVQDISVALDWEDNGYPESKTRTMHYPITASLKTIDSTTAKVTAVTRHPEGETPNYTPKSYVSGEKNIIRIPYSEHYTVSSGIELLQIPSDDNGCFTFAATRAYPLSDTQKVFTVLITGMDKADDESRLYTYAVTDSDASVTVRPSEEDGQVDVLVEKVADISNEDSFTFSLQRSVDGGTFQTVSNRLTADTPLIDMVDFEIRDLPIKNTDDTLYTYQYSYRLVPCDENGNELTGDNAAPFICTSTENENTVTLHGQTSLPKGVTPPTYLYYKVLLGIEVSKIITVQEGKVVKDENGPVLKDGHQQYDYENPVTGNGIIFENMPLYDASGTPVQYFVSEMPLVNKDTLDADTEKVRAIHDDQIYHLYTTAETHYTPNGSVVKEEEDQAGSYFSCAENTETYARHYRYQGSARAYVKKTQPANSTSTGAKADNDASPSVASSHYNILNTLPLTAVDVVKTWDDQSDKFNLRPYDIASSLHLKTAAVTDDELTAGEDLGSEALGEKTWTELDLSNEDYQKKENVFPSRSGNTYTYTYQKILKYDYDNMPYLFMIEEDQINAYDAPEYDKQYLDLTEVDKDDETTVGIASLSEQLTVENQLIVKKITVSKAWDDTSNCTGTGDEKKCKDAEDNALHYDVTPNLSAVYSGYEKENNNYVLTDGQAQPKNVRYDENNKTITKDGDPVEFVDLPVYDTANQPINWTIAETEKKYGYEKSFNPSASVQLLNGQTPSDKTVAITNTLPITQVTVTKTWDDQNNLFNIRPSSIKLTLYRTTKSDLAHDAGVDADESKGWVKVEEVTVTNSASTGTNTWRYTFQNLLKYNVDNQPYYFKVDEEEVKGYTTTYNKAVDLTTLGVTNTMQTIDVIVAKKWNDNGYSGSDVSHYNVQVTLINSSNFTLPASYAKVIGSAANDGSGVKFTKLPRYDADGTEIIYTVTESASPTEANAETGESGQLSGAYHNQGDPVTDTATETMPNTFTAASRRYGYEGTCKLEKNADGSLQFNILNTLPVVSFTAQKVWDDENNRDYARHDSIDFTLTRNADTYNVWTDKVETATATGWNADFGTYPQYSYANTEYTYSVSENLPNSSRYVVQDVTGNPQKKGINTHYVFTNKLDVTEKKLTVHKIWDDGDYKDTIRPTDLSNVKIELYSPDVVQSNSGSSQKVNDDDATVVNGIKSHIEAKQTANNTTAYNALTDEQKAAFIATLTNEQQAEYNALTDDDEKAAQALTWYQAAHPYVYQPALVQFTADITHPNYESTYVFDNLPVYMNVDGTATEAGTQSNWKAIRYYVVETFEVNGHVYQTKYSLTYDDNYTATASDAGTTLTNNGLSNPADKIIYVKNTPVTRDILVTKDWNDNYYGKAESAGADTTSERSKELHYQTEITLTGTAVLTQGEAATTVYPATTMYLAKANTDPTAVNNYKGVVFKDVPIYDKNGSVINYTVTEARNISGTAASGTDLQAPDSGDVLTDVAEGEFTQKKGTGEYSYGYEGSAKKAVKTEDSHTYVTRFHITDTLPLTAVTVNKHWIDQNNEFGLRPTGINDLNVNAANEDKLNLTLKRSSSSGYAAMHPTSVAEYTEWYQTTSNLAAANKWTYTYNKLLKYSSDNTAFTFQIAEEQVKLYEAPKYCISEEYDYDTDDDNSTVQNPRHTVDSVDALSDTEGTWNGLTPLEETFDITNKLETRDITVHKTWMDGDNTGTRYELDITLSSDAANTSDNRSAGGKYKEVKQITSTENGQYVTFENLPKYNKDGSVIVYNVREDAHSYQQQGGSVRDAVSGSAKADSEILTETTLPAFVDGYHHYGYYLSSAEYAAEKETVNGEERIYATAYYLTNTLPLTSVQATKTWSHDNSTFNKYHDSDITLTLTRSSNGGTSYSSFDDTGNDIVGNHSQTITYKSTIPAFENLAVYDYSNTAYYYKVQETDLPGYITSYDPSEGVVTAGDSVQTVAITNTQILGKANVVKIDQTHYDAYSDHSSGAYTDIKLKGAKFKLTCGDNDVYVKKIDGKYVPDNTGSYIVETDESGTISFDNFPLNTYTLTETEAPSGFLRRETPSVFTIDAEASATQATTTYDSGFIYSNESSENRIGNLQHVEDTTVTLVKSDKEDKNIKLANATYYLLQMVPYEFNSAGYTKEEYIAAADQVIKNCGGKLKDENNNWNENIIHFWKTSETLNGAHIPYVYTTNSEGKISAPQFMLAKTMGESAKVYRIDNGLFTIPAADIPSAGDLRLTVSGLQADDPNTGESYEFCVTDTAGTIYNNVTVSKDTPADGKVTVSITIPEGARTAGSDFRFRLRRKLTNASDDSYSDVPDSYGEGPITGLMNGRYVFVEVKAPEGYELSYCEPFEITDDNKVVHVEHKDPRKAASLDILKENEYGDPLGGGIFELYYRPEVKTAIKYYDINTAITSPTPATPTYSLEPDEPSVPTGVASGEPTYTYSYINSTVTPPEATDSNWILPRTDNDYIYFKDNWEWKTKPGNYGVNTDYGSDQSKGNYRMTIGDLFLNDTGIFATFYDKNRNKMGEYSVWERFVHYDDTNDDSHKNDVIWKIQPPDGAKYVNFHLGWDNYSKSTGNFEFTKGELYYKTDTNDNGHGTSNWIATNNGYVPLEGIGRKTDKTVGSSGVAYVPTADKLIFRRNSTYCWDNLHVIFYKQEGSEYKVLGEDYPGYLMEPYAYANKYYRIWFDDDEAYNQDNQRKFGSLCYEITIPEGATHFRINNGTKQTDSSGTYAGYGKYYTEMKAILHEPNRKNGGNYWKLKANAGATNKLNDERTNVKLETWSYDEIVAHDSYWDNGNSFTVESDNDFIFFKKPSNWKNTVYAYFYGGGDLRADNWQRAVYSIWPGLIPAGSKVEQNPTAGAYFNTDVQNMELRVDSTYQDKDGNTIYKFRMPLGDDTNYKKVMFSDGLIGSGTALNTGGGGGHESKVHDVEGGKGYTSNGSWTQTSAAGTTETYTFRETSSQTDYIYIVNNNADKWGDIHIKFYDGNGNRVGQGGNGYVMQYAGKWTAAEALANLTSNPTNGLTDAEKQALANTAVGDYYRVPVPANAVKFALDNGNSSYNKNRYTGKYDIQPDHIQVYAIQGNVSGQSLQPVSPLTTVKRVQNGTSSQTNDTDYTVRTHVKGSDTVNDYLYPESVKLSKQQSAAQAPKTHQPRHCSC